MPDRPTRAAPKARTERLIVRQIEDEWLYYDLDSHKAICLNPFSARVLQLCDGNRTISDIVDAMQPDEVDEGMVELTLDKLAKAGLLEQPYRSVARTVARTSRRDMIRAVGASAGTLAMVPIVSAVIVPGPAQSMSCLPNWSICVTDSECCSGDCRQIFSNMRCRP